MAAAEFYDGAFFNDLRADAGEAWGQYVAHPFVQGIGAGDLPETAFRHFLIQDYLFLIQFSRAWALAAYKGETLKDIQTAAATLNAIADTEMALHVRYCRNWGIDEAAMEQTPETSANIAYTRYVLETGLRGDLLDLHVALAPCIVGYGEIGRMLSQAEPVAGNPYQSWIDIYAGAEYQDVAQTAVTTLDDLWQRRGSDARRAAVQKIFDAATRLEINFWQMGLDAA